MRRVVYSALHLRRIISYSTTTNHLLHNPIPPPPFSVSRTFCSQTAPIFTPPQEQDQDQDQAFVASLAAEIHTNPDVESLPVHKRLELSFSHVNLTPALVLQTLNASPEAARGAFDLFKWVKGRSDFELTDEVISYFVAYFGRNKDFRATHDLLLEGKGVVGEKSFEAAIDRLVRAGRPTQAVAFFERMETDYGLVKGLDSLKVVVGKLCDHGFASYAEKMAKGLATEIFPDQYICDMLIKGWCVDDKFDEALRFAGEMYRGGFELSTFACNQILDCVCRLCRKKDPFRIKSEAENVLYAMEEKGIPRDVETFNVLIRNLCKMRKTEDAMNLFRRMGEWGCDPDETTFIMLIRSLYQAARVGEGDEMIDRMKSAGYGAVLDTKEYYGLLKILCGVERIEHAMKVFEKMKADGCKPGIKTYDLLMGKLVNHGLVNWANHLYKEAANSGVPVEPKRYRVDPRFVKKKPTAVKKEKKRETFPEKMARKRKTLKKIRLSFVKKPKRRMH